VLEVNGMSRIVNNRIEGTRITVWDVYLYVENGCSIEEIRRWLPLTEEQVKAAIEYIDANREYVVEGHRKIEERNARGNPPEIEEKLRQTRQRMQEWLQQRRAVTR
jgi:uncharacterized protein (DUF433 family)